ncbi:hypothetical protein M231_05878 [Tremella mesenterica]|uniref:Uncharacterized protein n=1 Tax=Tremella mesenterica TaxID=5217 RepID=A0A4Q1BGY8_TREME|nr:hypothetical protein M231_05878 [Tremella mesenterica]
MLTNHHGPGPWRLNDRKSFSRRTYLRTLRGQDISKRRPAHSHDAETGETLTDNRVETPPSSPEANESSTRESMVGETVTTASPETNPAQGTPDDESEAARLQQISEETHDVDEDPQ